jgi:hypothetical protein
MSLVERKSGAEGRDINFLLFRKLDKRVFKTTTLLLPNGAS